MRRPDFDHAWLNANGLAELAFLRSLAKAFAAARQPRTDDERAAIAEFAERVAQVDEHTFDWSAFAGVEGFGIPAAEGAAPLFEAAPALPSAAGLDGVPTFADAVAFDDDPEQGLPDIARYLEHVERARAALEPRIAHAHAGIDASVLDALLAPLGDTAACPALAQPLGPDAFTRWLERYEQEDPAVVALVCELRKFEPGL